MNSSTPRGAATDACPGSIAGRGCRFGVNGETGRRMGSERDQPEIATDHAPLSDLGWAYERVGDGVAYHARASGWRIACFDLLTGRATTYAELNQRIDQCAGWLAASLERGSRVALLARNDVDFLTVHFACERAGMIFQPLNWRLSGSEMRALVEDAQPALLIYQEEFENVATQALKGGTATNALRITADHNPLAEAINLSAPLSRACVDPDAPIMLLYTSGTTGRSKGTIVTSRNVWAGALNFAFAFGVAPSDTLLCDMPMFHVASLGVARSALLVGARVLISDRFVASETLARLSDRRLNITHYFAVPQVAASLLQDPAFTNSDLGTLKALAVGGAPLPENVVREYLSRGVPILNTYGVSEAMGTVLAMPANCDLIAEKPASCGVPAMLIDVRLVGADQHDVEAGGVGEIWLRGPCITPGYWRQKDATEKAFEGEWLRTGDAARRDGNGFFWIVDRWKDMYISGGENIYPAEVEAVLSEHAGVAEIAVIGVPDDRWGEVGCAYIVPRPGCSLTREEVDAYCRGRIAAFKIPKHVRLVDDLPRTASGKIRKGSLRQTFSERNV